MSKTDTRPALLDLCIWDLAEGCRSLAERLPGVAGHADDRTLRAQLDGAINEARERAARLGPLTSEGDGPKNLWMAGILDDVERDTKSVARGTLLDIAMIGAVRKAFFAEIASIHTAHALAEARGDDRTVGALDRNLADLEDRDASLAETLARLAQVGRGEAAASLPSAQTA